MGLASLLFGEQKKPYAQFVKDSWAQVRQEDEQSLMHLRMPKPEARLGADHAQTPTYGRENKRANDKYDKRKAEVEENNSPTQRWKRKIDHMMATGNPDLQDIAMKNLLGRQQTAEQTKARDKREYTKNGHKIIEIGGSKEGFVQPGYMTGDKFNPIGPQKRNMPESSDLQKYKLLAAAGSPEEYQRIAKGLGFNKTIDLGTMTVNPMTGEKWNMTEDREGSNKAHKLYQNEFIQDFDMNIAKGDKLNRDLDRTKSMLTRLSGMSDYSTTGFAKWVSGLPLIGANNWKTVRDTLVSRIGLMKLQELKESTKNGSTGFGSLSAPELQLLLDNMGSLAQEQDPYEAKKIMAQIYEQMGEFQDSVNKKQKGYAEKYKKFYGEVRNDDQYSSDLSRWDEDKTDTTDSGAGDKPKGTVTRAELLSMGATAAEAEADGFKVID